MMVKATIHFILNTVRNIFMRLYSSVEEVVTICLVYKIWWLLCPYPPPLPTHPPKNFFFWIGILFQNSLTTELKIRFVGLVL